jgi:hypothetical protein
MRAIPLDPSKADRFEELIGIIVAGLRKGIAGLEVSEPIDALCVLAVYDPDFELLPGVVHVRPPEQRRAALADTHPGERQIKAWVAASWNSDEDELPAWPARALKLSQGLSDALEESGVDDALIWTLEEACLALNEDPPAGVSDEFVAYPSNGMFSNSLVASLRYVIPETLWAKLVRQGLVSDANPYGFWE